MCGSYITSIQCVQKPATQYLLQCLIFILFIVAGISQMDPNNYGPYVMSWETFETCKGPKQAGCGKFEVGNIQNMSDVIFLLDFPKDCPATTAKIVISAKSDNVTRKLWNYVLNKPCEHFVLGPILVESFNLTKSCKVNKGQYEIHLDFAAKSKMFLGSKFFYGDYIFQIMSYNKVNNFFCVKTEMIIKKPSLN